MSYKVVEVNGKKAIVDENGRKVSPEFDFIYEGAGLLKNESPYYLVANTNEDLTNIEFAIFDVNGNMVTPRWFKFASAEGLVKGEKNQYLVVREDGKMAILDKDGKMVTKEWYDYIYPFDFFKRDKEIYLAVKDGNVAVFDENGNQKIEWQKMGIEIPEFGSNFSYETLLIKILFYEGPVKQSAMSAIYEKIKESVEDSLTRGITEWFDARHYKKLEISPDTKEETQKQENTVSNIVDKLNLPETIFEAHMDNRYNVKYFANLGILEIYDREKDSTTVIDLKYKDDVDLKKGPSAPGM